MKIIINTCYGGFCFSRAAIDLYVKRGGMFMKQEHDSDLRTDPVMIQIVEQMKGHAADKVSHLVVITIPDDIEWYVDQYDGIEWVAEKHRTWNQNGEST